MKRITCEMCGSTDLIKKDGVFECQSCGTKYSVEEAKKMMVEGTVEVQGTVKIDSSNRIDNLIKNAKTLYHDGKTAEAYNLFGEVLNIDTENYIAIIYRGFCSAWTTTIAKPKHIDAVNGITRGFELALKDLGETKEFADFCLETVEEIEKIGEACLNLYINYHKKELNIYSETLERLTQSLKREAGYADIDFYKRQQNNAQIRIDNAKKNCLDGIELTVTALNVVMAKIIDAKGEIYSVKDYKKIKAIIEAYLKKAAGWSLSEEQLKEGSILMIICDNKMKKLGDKKREEYWNEHKEEKQEIEKQIKDCDNKIVELNEKMDNLKDEKTELEKKMNDSVPSEKELKKLNSQLEKLQDEKNSLGLFKMKEKKEIQEKIDETDNEIKNIEKKIQNEKDELKKQYTPDIESLDEEILRLEKEVEEIAKKKENAENELNKDRD